MPFILPYVLKPELQTPINELDLNASAKLYPKNKNIYKVVYAIHSHFLKH